MGQRSTVFHKLRGYFSKVCRYVSQRDPRSGVVMNVQREAECSSSHLWPKLLAVNPNSGDLGLINDEISGEGETDVTAFYLKNYPIAS